MTKTQAIAKLSKLFGKNFAYREDKTAPDAEGRKAASEILRVVRAELTDLEARTTARRNALLEADAEYRGLCGQLRETRKRKDALSCEATGYRISVGTAGSLFFTVDVQADTWDEAVRKAVEKRAA